MKIDKFEIKGHEFSHPIEIQRHSDGDGVDDDNIPVKKGWYKLFSTRAKILANKSDEQKMMDGISEVVNKTFYIRASRKNKITKKDRIIYNNEIYNIKSVIDIQEKGIYLDIKAEYIE